jgi:hypothetical protein
MSIRDHAALASERRITNIGLDRANDGGTSHRTLDLTSTDAQVAADRVVEHWINASRSLVLACAYFVAGLSAFERDSAKRDAFLAHLVAKGVFSQNDVLAQLKANGKLAMLMKIGRHAEALLQPNMLRLLPAHYSIIYQICLLIEEVGRESAEGELTGHPDATRDDVIKIRAALKPLDKEREPIASTALDDSVAQLFALRLTGPALRPFAEEYPGIDTLHRCLRRPQPADDAGLVALVPIMMLGTFERALMPLLGFDAPDGLFLEKGVDRPDITDRDVIVVAKRGSFRPQPLAAFPPAIDGRELLALAESFFPDCTVKCQPFAKARADGWLTLVDDENLNERPTVR